MVSQRRVFEIHIPRLVVAAIAVSSVSLSLHLSVTTAVVGADGLKYVHPTRLYILQQGDTLLPHSHVHQTMKDVGLWMKDYLAARDLEGETILGRKGAGIAGFHARIPGVSLR